MTNKVKREWLLTPEEQDNCSPSEAQLEAYLAKPNDKIAESLTVSEKRLVAKCILYGENIMKAALAKAEPLIRKDERERIIERLRQLMNVIQSREKYNGVKESIKTIQALKGGAPWEN